MSPKEPEPDRGRALVESWQANAVSWTHAIRSRSIASRRLATDNAIVEAVLRRRPRSVLDIGCGEGWLARALAPTVDLVVGMDASADLVAAARDGGGGIFHRALFADLVADPTRFGRSFDVVAANFALLDDALEPLLAALSTIAAPGGALVVQTLHPLGTVPPYRDGWREESFSGFGAGSWKAMPWYFRTVGSWLMEIGRHWELERLEEPLNPATELPASLVVTATRREPER